MIRPIFLLILILPVIGEGAFERAIPLTDTRRVVASVRLRRADGIPQTVYAYRTSRVGDAETSEIYQVVFGRLNRRQFEHLKRVYPASSAVRYERGRIYELIDFLPPTIQALVNHRFIIQTQILGELQRLSALNPSPTDRNSLLVQTNCWNTALEVLRAETDRIAIAFGDSPAVLGAFRNPRYSERVRFLDRRQNPVEVDRILSPAAIGERNRGLEPGDLLLIPSNDGQELKHAAIFIDDDFYFEKTGTEDPFLYRLVPYSEIIRIYGVPLGEGRFWFGNTGGFEFRRFSGERLPHPRFLFQESLNTHTPLTPALSSLVTSSQDWRGPEAIYRFSPMVDLRLVENRENGRMQLERSAYLEETFRVSDPGIAPRRRIPGGGVLRATQASRLRRFPKESNNTVPGDICAIARGTRLSFDFYIPYSETEAYVYLRRTPRNCGLSRGVVRNADYDRTFFVR